MYMYVRACVRTPSSHMMFYDVTAPIAVKVAHPLLGAGNETMSTRAELEKELFSACEAGDVDRVRRVVAAGVDPKKAISKGFFQESPLHRASRYICTSFRLSLREVLHVHTMKDHDA